MVNGTRLDSFCFDHNRFVVKSTQTMKLNIKTPVEVCADKDGRKYEGEKDGKGEEKGRGRGKGRGRRRDMRRWSKEEKRRGGGSGGTGEGVTDTFCGLFARRDGTDRIVI